MQTTIDSFACTASVDKLVESIEMETQISKMSKTLDVVMQKMMVIEKKFESLVTKEQLQSSMDRLRIDIEKKNQEMIDRLESRVFDLETENDTEKKAEQIGEQD